ncbi:hypothetical protein HKX48_007325 [Thoreauomyces humboldtii]|nr:hypothetical protein HKX48_007325 [Thoreauomyces humboldtii]
MKRKPQASKPVRWAIPAVLTPEQEAEKHARLTAMTKAAQERLKKQMKLEPPRVKLTKEQIQAGNEAWERFLDKAPKPLDFDAVALDKWWDESHASGLVKGHRPDVHAKKVRAARRAGKPDPPIEYYKPPVLTPEQAAEKHARLTAITEASREKFRKETELNPPSPPFLQASIDAWAKLFDSAPDPFACDYVANDKWWTDAHTSGLMKSRILSRREAREVSRKAKR